MENKISIASLGNSEHIERLCLMSNFFHDLKDLEVLTKMKKLKSLYILDWNDLDNLESLLESASLKEIYLGNQHLIILYIDIKQKFLIKTQELNLR